MKFDLKSGDLHGFKKNILLVQVICVFSGNILPTISPSPLYLFLHLLLTFFSPPSFLPFLYHSFLPFLPLLRSFRSTFSPPSSVLPSYLFSPSFLLTFYHLSFLPTFSLLSFPFLSAAPNLKLSLSHPSGVISMQDLLCFRNMVFQSEKKCFHEKFYNLDYNFSS